MLEDTRDNGELLPVGLVRNLERLVSFLLAAAVGFALISTNFVESLHTARLAAALVGFVLLHLMIHRKLVISRESIIYAGFFCYMLIQLAWTPDLRLSMNTVIPAASFIVTLILVGSLMTYHDTRTVLSGLLAGVTLGVVGYTLVSGFPFSYPAEFSYNAVASMYLFGLILALILSVVSRSGLVFVAVGLVFLAHVVATTSIKTNLGILLGATVSGFFYVGHLTRLVRRYAILLTMLVGLLAYLIASNAVLVAAILRGWERVILGLSILQARSDLPGYSAMASRSNWTADGIAGWLQNPVFGYGVEAFRSRFGATSHSTPIDLLYNSGLIGLLLYYAVFVSVFLRLCSVRRGHDGALQLTIFAALLCYAFISFSGIVHINPLIAAFIAIGVVLLGERSSEVRAGGDGLSSVVVRRPVAAPRS